MQWLSDDELILATNKINGQWDIYRILLTDRTVLSLTQDDKVESDLALWIIDYCILDKTGLTVEDSEVHHRAAGGAITLACSYTPWGELLEQHGGGDPSASSGQALTWGYCGGLLAGSTCFHTHWASRMDYVVL
ncbi:MAG: hypothetical protein DRI37_01425 [Chloroflexi bacterium]|nr:MAG: hypothetical protein DRI37_01425 [Chloroflexota bacterium]